MTSRQKALGVTEHGYQAGIVEGNWMRDIEAFAAKAATLKRGAQYHGKDIIKMWMPEYADMDGFVTAKREECIPYLNGISIMHPEAYHYTNTHGLDLLTVR